jgi:hypothetical protein
MGLYQGAIAFDTPRATKSGSILVLEVGLYFRHGTAVTVDTVAYVYTVNGKNRHLILGEVNRHDMVIMATHVS